MNRYVTNAEAARAIKALARRIEQDWGPKRAEQFLATESKRA